MAHRNDAQFELLMKRVVVVERGKWYGMVVNKKKDEKGGSTYINNTTT